jgi:hypothetical protein
VGAHAVLNVTSIEKRERGRRMSAVPEGGDTEAKQQKK